jgi:hypothetical protein
MQQRGVTSLPRFIAFRKSLPRGARAWAVRQTNAARQRAPIVTLQRAQAGRSPPLHIATFPNLWYNALWSTVS